MNALQFLVDHGASVLFWVVFVEQAGLPVERLADDLEAGVSSVGRGADELAAPPHPLTDPGLSLRIRDSERRIVSPQRRGWTDAA